MAHQFKKGYYVKGQFVALGSPLDAELKLELKGDAPVSRGDLKAASQELQDLGEALLELRADLLEGLSLPERLVQALEDAKCITAFGGKRRQMQYIGKLMRLIDEETVERAKVALTEQYQPDKESILLLHTAENWRDRLLQDNSALEEWVSAFPQTDIQHLRSLLRQAKKDSEKKSASSQEERHSRTFRELFQLIKSQLSENN